MLQNKELIQAQTTFPVSKQWPWVKTCLQSLTLTQMKSHTVFYVKLYNFEGKF